MTIFASFVFNKNKFVSQFVYFLLYICIHWTHCTLKLSTFSYALSQITVNINKPLHEEEWFHGILPRDEVIRLLKNNGDFLLRETVQNNQCKIVLSVCWHGHKHYIVQATNDGFFRFEGPAFSSISDLILHLYSTNSEVTRRTGAQLKKPILRERWELKNSDVILEDVIGRVRHMNFFLIFKTNIYSFREILAMCTGLF